MYKKQNNLAGTKGLVFLLQEMYQYKWYSIVLPFLACLSQVSQSFILIMLPKIVLDAVENRCGLDFWITRITAAGIGLAIVTLLNLIIHNEIVKCSQTFLYRRLTVLWEKKTLRLDYNIFISNQGKITMEKARHAICSPNWGAVELLGRLAGVLEAGAGLLSYCMIVGRLHPFMIVFLGILFAMELACGIETERKKQGLKDERARADRRLNYIAYGTKGIKEAKDIRMYSMSALLKTVSQECVRNKCSVETKVQKWQFVHMAVTSAMILLRDSIAYLFLIYCYLFKGMSIGDFSFYFAVITGIGMWLTKMSDAVAGFKEAKHSVLDFYEFMMLPEEDDTRKSTVEIKGPISFELKDVSFSYSVQSENREKQVPIIRNMNLHVKAGEKLAIVGINGAGKSTLIKLLCGMLTPDKGEILVNGIDSRAFPKKEYYELFSAVFQKLQLLPVSIADNIMLNVRTERDGALMWDCLRKAGLEEKIKSLPGKENTCLVKQVSEDGIELSGGQEQRLLLARALYKNAPVLILDEPTAALDPISENDIYQKYSRLTEGKTSFFVSHRLASTRFCDRIIFLENGEIVESGTHDELMKRNGRYADMFRVQSKYYQNDGEVEADFA